MRNRIYYALSAVLAFAFCYDVAHAQQVGYPVRPLVQSLGAGCNSQQFATNELGGSTIKDFICIGQYPYTAQDPLRNGFLALTVPTGAATGSYASFYTFENTDGNAAFGLSDGGGVNGLTVGGDYEGNYNNVKMWELGSRFTGSFAFMPENLLGTHQSFFLLGDPGGAPGSDTFRLVLQNNANGCLFCPAIMGVNVDQSGTATWNFGTMDPSDGSVGPANILSATYTEVSGAFTTATMAATTLNFDATTFDVDAASDFSGNVNLSGTATLTVAGAVSGSSGALNLNDDVTLGGTLELGGVLDTNDFSLDDLVDDNVNVAADMSVVGDLNVTGTITGTLTGQGAVYGCYIDSAASAERCSTGFSVTVAGTLYTVTHNLGLSDANDLAISCTLIVSPADDRVCQVESTGVNSFVLQPEDVGAGVVNNAMMFTAVRTQ